MERREEGRTESRMNELRLPDFVVIGAMKSATSTLVHWFRARSDVHMARPKETNYFAFPKSWDQGIDWYSGQFAEATKSQSFTRLMRTPE